MKKCSFPPTAVGQNRQFIFSWGAPYNLVADSKNLPQKNLTFSAVCTILKIVRTFFGGNSDGLESSISEPPFPTDRAASLAG